jgi:hypothetical protein
MNLKAITTADGYFYTQLPSGWYTDGDVEFDYINTDIVGIVWDNMDGQYCADGDGMVVVAHDGFNWVVTDQGDPVFASDSLRASLVCAMQQLATNYPEIYANFMGE